MQRKKRKKRERERYAKMTNKKKQEMLKRLCEAYHEKQKNKESLKGSVPGSTITGQARLIVGNIIHDEDGRIDSCQDVHAGDGTEKLGNIIGKLN